MKKVKLFVILLIVFVAGCEKTPVKDLLFPNVNDAKTWNNEWIIYSGVDGIFGEDVRTNDRDPIKPLTNYWDTHVDEFSMNYTKQHHTGRTCIMMRWNGAESKAYDLSISRTVNYVGFYLQSKLESRVPDSEVGIDISPGGYQYLEFWVKGYLSYGVVFKVTSDACGGESGATYFDLSDSWQLKRIQITTPNGADPAKKVITMGSFVLEAVSVSNGGEIYIDDVRYTK